MLSAKKMMAIALALIVTVIAGMTLSGCGSDQKQQKEKQAAQVKIMDVVVRDAPLTRDYAGQVISVRQVQVKPRVTGNIVEKYVKGGEYVTEGQPLYKIDSRAFRSQLLAAQANLAQAQVDLEDAEVDLARYEQLYQSAAISEQTYTHQQASVAAKRKNIENLQALVDVAEVNLSDTTVYAPMSGKLALDDVAVGTMAAAGSTTLVTIGTSNPMYIQFSISENEYLWYVQHGVDPTTNLPDIAINLVLSDGNAYPSTGRIVEVDRALDDNSGALVVKAEFANPNNALLPGMYARARMIGDTVKNAKLVPQRAVQQLLGKSFVMVVGEDGKSVAKNVELGPVLGSYYIVESGLETTDKVVVEGLTNLTEGVPLNVTTITGKELGLSFDEAAAKTVDAAK